MPFPIFRAFSILLCLLSLLAGCSPRQTPVTEISAPSDAMDSAVATYVPPAADWPWWRGPTRNGIALSASAPVEFGEHKNVIWQSEIPGRGHSSPTISGSKVFLATADDAAGQQLVIALDRETGDKLWSTVVNEGGFPAEGQMHHKSTHANGTLATNGEALFIAFLHHDKITAYALDLEGTVLWEQELGAFNAKFGYAPSPVVYRSLVIFAADNQGGGYLAAVDQASGEIVWRKAREAVATYSSPVVANLAGKDQLLISGGEKVISYNPATGAEYWTCEGTAEATCGTPVWDGDLVFASGGYPQRETLAIDANTGERVWSNSTKCYEQSLLAAEGYLYSFADGGIVYCWEAATGQEQWKKRLGGSVSVSPVLCGGNIYAANEQGTFYVFRADPAEFKLVAENQLGQSSFASPVICGGRIYQRVGFQSTSDVLYCFGQEGAE